MVRWLLAAWLVCAGSVLGQLPSRAVSSADRAVLEDPQPRKELGCSVRGMQPILGYDFRLHAGYEARVQLEEPMTDGARLRVVLRISSETGTSAPVFFGEAFAVPKASDLRKRRIDIAGAFGLGEGSYRVDWLVRDPAGRVCSSHWKVEAKLPKQAMGISFVPPGSVQSNTINPFRRESLPARPLAGPPLRAKVLVNFASRSVSSAILQPQNLEPVLAVLRALVKQGRIRAFSVVGFLLADQRVFYRQREQTGIDFPLLGKALRDLELGTVEYERLSRERGQQHFLADLLKAEAGGTDAPDALIIVSPRVRMFEDIPTRELKKLGRLGYPVFYFKTGRIPLPDPSDAIGRVIRLFKGREYRILKPAETGWAVTDAVARINVTRQTSGTGVE